MISANLALISALKLLGGHIVIESPECIPALSICSSIPGISISSPSQIASSSTSTPFKYLSIKTGLCLSLSKALSR